MSMDAHEDPVRPIGDGDEPTAPNTAETAAMGVPGPLDAAIRDVIAVRSLAASLVAMADALGAMCDAALTNLRTAQLASDAAARVVRVPVGATQQSIDELADRLRGKKTGRPKFFGERMDRRTGASAPREPDNAGEGGGASDDALRVPPMGGEIPPS